MKFGALLRRPKSANNLAFLNIVNTYVALAGVFCASFNSKFDSIRNDDLDIAVDRKNCQKGDLQRS